MYAAQAVCSRRAAAGTHSHGEGMGCPLDPRLQTLGTGCLTTLHCCMR